MGLLGWMKNQLIDVIEWLDDSNDTLVWRFPHQNHEIKNGAQLTVREGQVAILVSEGQIGDVYKPGLHKLTTSNMPILTSLSSWKYGFESPFKVEVYFVNTRQFVDLRWGTLNPIMLRDKDFGIVRVRAFGMYGIRVEDAALFFKELVGTDGHYKTEEIEGALRKMLVSKFTTAVGRSEIPALDMAANYEVFADRISTEIAPSFEAFGIRLTSFVVENISLPEEVEKAMDTRSQMGALGDMNRFTQFQTAYAIREAAQNEGGGAGQAMGLGAGLGMGHALAAGMATGLGQPAAPQAAAPPQGGGSAPPPLSGAPANPFRTPPAQFHIHLNGASMGPYGLDVLRDGVNTGQFTAETPVWKDGMANWTPAGQVTELKGLFGAGSPPPFAPPAV